VPEGTPWLFATREGKPLTTEGLYRLVKRCLTRAGIQKRQMGPHLLRRTFASLLRAAGSSKTDIAELLGHTPSTGTKAVDQSYLSAEANEQALQATPDPLAGLYAGHGRLGR
jgi:site-specific recombinase XerD